MPDRSERLRDVKEAPVVPVDEIFAANEKVRWAVLVTNRGDVLLNQMRPGVESYSPPQFDQEFASLGPLTILGVCERYSDYLKGVDHVAVWFGLAAFVYARLGSQVLAVSIEKDPEAVDSFVEWLEGKQKQLGKGS